MSNQTVLTFPNKVVNIIGKKVSISAAKRSNPAGPHITLSPSKWGARDNGKQRLDSEFSFSHDDDDDEVARADKRGQRTHLYWYGAASLLAWARSLHMLR